MTSQFIAIGQISITIKRKLLNIRNGCDESKLTPRDKVTIFASMTYATKGVLGYI